MLIAASSILKALTSCVCARSALPATTAESRRVDFKLADGRKLFEFKHRCCSESERARKVDKYMHMYINAASEENALLHRLHRFAESDVLNCR